MTLLEIGDAILEILPKVEFVHSRVLMDHKYYGHMGGRTKMELPAADVGMVSGCVRTEEKKEVLQEMRAKCKVLIANGACASWGGVPSGSNIDESRPSGAIGLCASVRPPIRPRPSHPQESVVGFSTALRIISNL
jgi:coenzyme F420-reducing hydrogenase gamma subunit